MVLIKLRQKKSESMGRNWRHKLRKRLTKSCRSVAVSARPSVKVAAAAKTPPLLRLAARPLLLLSSLKA
jgi:hypothetical protein